MRKLFGPTISVFSVPTALAHSGSHGATETVEKTGCLGDSVCHSAVDFMGYGLFGTV